MIQITDLASGGLRNLFHIRLVGKLINGSRRSSNLIFNAQKTSQDQFFFEILIQAYQLTIKYRT